MQANDWEALLSERLERRVEVRYGRARTEPVRMVSEGAGSRVRLHRFFAQAPVEIREALASWLRAGRRARRACELLDAWIDFQLAALPPAPRRRAPLESCGVHHDLHELARPLWREEFRDDFEPLLRPALTWGRRGRTRARHSLQFGSYLSSDNLVRVHRVLDRDWVPDWFVAFVLFHEILHAALPEGTGHGPEFRLRERAQADFRRARAWQRRHLPALIRAARRG